MAESAPGRCPGSRDGDGGWKGWAAPSTWTGHELRLAAGVTACPCRAASNAALPESRERRQTDGGGTDRGGDAQQSSAWGSPLTRGAGRALPSSSSCRLHHHSALLLQPRCHLCSQNQPLCRLGAGGDSRHHLCRTDTKTAPGAAFGVMGDCRHTLGCARRPSRTGPKG